MAYISPKQPSSISSEVYTHKPQVGTLLLFQGPNLVSGHNSWLGQNITIRRTSACYSLTKPLALKTPNTQHLTINYVSLKHLAEVHIKKHRRL